MADLDAYPSTFKQLVGSTEEWLDSVAIDRAVSGAAKARSFFTAKKRRFTLRHILTASQCSTLQTLYNANRKLRVTLTWSWDQANYVCFFEGPPKFKFITPTLAETEVVLVEQ